MLTRLYGFDAFNQEIGVPYLFQNPPNHWALCQLGQSLPGWLEEGNFKDLDCAAADIDAAAQRSFWAGANESVDFGALSEKEILSKRLSLQPHVYLFELDDDLFTFRDELLKEEVCYWSENPYPELREGACFFALYRNPKNQVKWKELMVREHHLLSLFKEGTSIQEACTKIEDKGGQLFQEAQELLPLWFREWTFLKWFQEA